MTVVITKPSSGATLSGVIPVEATFNGKNFDIATVTVDGKQLASDSAQPISFSIDTSRVSDGAHTLTVAVRYRTASGAHRWQKASIPIATEGNDMQANLSTSGGSANLAGTVTVTVSIQPPQQAELPVSCKFLVDGVQKALDTSYPLTFAWDTTTVADGTHVLKAVVTAGPRTRSAQGAMTVSVFNNVLPPPPPPPPIQAAPVNTIVPTISGTATEGQMLVVSPGTWENSPTSYTRQWTRCDAAGANCVDIASATGASYVLTAADVGKTIRCWTTAYNSFGASAAVQTAQTAVVQALAPAIPVVVTAPVVSGTPTQGQTLIVSNGSWTNAPTSYTRQWKRCDSSGGACASVTGATATTYVLTATDVGKTIRCETVAVNASGSSAASQSAATSVVVIPPPPEPPPTGLPFSEAVLRAGYNTLTVPAGTQNITAPAGNDCLIDLQNIERTIGTLLIWGSANQRIKVINGRWNITKPIDGAPYWRGGPRIRTVDGIGPEHISLTDMLVRGSTVADAMAIAAGSQTKVTIQRCRFESPYQTTGANTAEPSEHPDAIHLQGNARVIEIGLCTLFAASVDAPNDGGKCIMLNDDWSPNYEALHLNKVNMRGQGARTGTFLYQDIPSMDINLTDVYAHKEGAGAFVWSSGSGLFYPNSSAGAAVAWTSSGTAPNRIADWPDAASIFGVIKEGLPTSGDYSTRAHFGL